MDLNTLLIGGVALFVLAIGSLFAWRLALVVGVVVLGLGVLLLPNGALLLGGLTAVAVVYIVFRFGRAVGGSIDIDCGDGDGDRNISIDYRS